MLIHPYNPNWIDQFKAIKAAIESRFHGVDCRIEHVGSTAVPGLAAKPIIDIDIAYRNMSNFKKIKIVLEQLDYRHHGDQGIKHREVFKRAGNNRHEILDGIRHHLYVCHENSEPFKEHIRFRDLLRRNEEVRQSYQNLKYKLADEAGQDRKVYARLKEEARFLDDLRMD